jgi:hypothetical protein
VALAGSAFGQTTTRPGETAAISGATAVTETPGRIKGTKVNVRCDSGLAAYVCTQLSAPAAVRIVERVPGTEFYKILPPDGTFSAVAKDAVKPDATGKTGTVIADSATFNAGGEQRTSDFFYRQGQLKKGDTVTIIGATDKFYEIAPPAGTFFYIAARYVATGDDATGPSEVSVGAPRQNVSGPASRPAAPARAAQPRPKAPAPEPATGAMADFQAAEKMLTDEWGKPAEDRNLAGLMAKYQAIKLDSGEEYLKSFIDSRVTFVESAIQARKDTDEAKAQKIRLDNERKATDDKLSTIARDKPVGRITDFFITQGVIGASELYPNGVLGKRYQIRDPQTLHIVAYAQCTTGKVDLDTYLGKLVGIKGDPVYDKTLGVDVVEADSVTPLSDAKVEFAPPATPVVKPLPAAAPTPAPAREPPAATPAAQPPVGPTVTPPPAPKASAPEAKFAPAADPTAKPAAEPKPAQTPTTAPADSDAATPRPEFQLNAAEDATATITLPPTGLRVAPRSR